MDRASDYGSEGCRFDSGRAHQYNFCMGQRRDVQGLRAVAVLLVLLYHFDLGVRGGYLGVDMFFVISGYVISRSTLTGIQKEGRFDWRRFYLRRIRRLLPAITVVSVATTLASLLTLSPFGQQQIASKMLLSVGTYISNIVLIKSDYFALDSGSNPLLHMWSLAVEEQFYVMWGPVVLSVLFSMRKGGARIRLLVKYVLAAALLGSFGMFILFIRYEPIVVTWWGFRFLNRNGITPAQLAFYLPITRAWEFGAGAVLATRFWTVRARIKHHWVGDAGFVLSCAMVGLAVSGWMSLDETAVIVAVAGTVGLIFFSQYVRALRFVLENRAIVKIGDISYSVYLWHWPIWVIFGALFSRSILTTFLAVVLTFVFAAAQYKFLEQPIRKVEKLRRIRGRHMVAGFMTMTLVVSLMMNQFTPAIAKNLIGATQADLATHIVDNPCIGRVYSLGTTSSCWYGDKDSVGLAILVGDSQAKSLSDGFVAAARNLNMNALVFSRPGCPIMSVDAIFPCERNEWRADMWAAMKTLGPKVVIVTNLNYLYTEELPYENLSKSELRVSWGIETVKTIKRIKSFGSKVIISEPPPVFLQDVRSQVSLLNKSFAREPFAQVHKNLISARAAEHRAINAYGQSQIFLNFSDMLCSETSCSQFINGKLAYEDPSHLSKQGSLTMINKITDAIHLVLDAK